MGNAFVPPVVDDPEQNLYNEENGSSTITTASVSATNVLTYNNSNQTYAGLQALGYQLVIGGQQKNLVKIWVKFFLIGRNRSNKQGFVGVFFKQII